MDEFALMTVEITLADKNLTIAIGGPPDQAIAMQLRLAEEMNLPLPERDALLLLTLEAEDMKRLIMPILADFPDLGWCFVDKMRKLENKLFSSSRSTILN